MQFGFPNSYVSNRIPLFARNVVSTSHPLAAQAGLRILLKGGNAVDAAVAAAAAMTICEPTGCGLGSDAFCILWDGKALHGLNASGRAPKAWSPAYFTKKYGEASSPPLRGMDAVTVPGAVSGWVALSERFGALPFADLMEPAIDLAERGYLVPPILQLKWAAAADELSAYGGFGRTFLPWGRAPHTGELFTFPAAAKALRLIGQTNGAAFYQGPIAQAIERFGRQHGGSISAQDFADHRCDWVQPISQIYRGHQVHEIGPNGQGIAALMALGILEHFDVRGLAVDSAASQHLQIEAMKLAFADVYRHVAEPSAMTVTPQDMLDPAYLASRARLIRLDCAQDFQAGNPVRGGTIYLTTADESGMMVSFIQSNYLGFGSGCVEPEFGISLQNRGHAFSLSSHSPNVVAPGKRPFHTIIPAFLSQDNEPVMSFGVMGANMQPQGHVQTLVRMLDYKQNPQTACDAPRWCFASGMDVKLEGGMPAQTIQGLSDLGHRITLHPDPYADFGAGQFIWRMGDPATQGYVAASDPRRDGQAVGF